MVYSYRLEIGLFQLIFPKVNVMVNPKFLMNQALFCRIKGLIVLPFMSLYKI